MSEFYDIDISGSIKGSEYVGSLIGFVAMDPVVNLVNLSANIKGANYVGKVYGGNMGSTTGNVTGVNTLNTTKIGPGESELVGEWNRELY